MGFEYTVRQCAQKLGVSETRVHQLIREGALPAELIAGRYFVDEDAVIARANVAPRPGRPLKKLRGNPQRFTLMSRTHEVFDFIYDDRFDEFVAVERIIDASRAPLGLVSPRGKKISLSALTYWWRHRAIPLSRAGMATKLADLGLSDPSRIPFKSLGLSLSDQYWIRPIGSDIEWEAVNLFNNEFPDSQLDDWLAQVGLESPDNTSEGQLSKRWVRMNGVPTLLKGGGALDQEPYNEVVATQLHRRLLAKDDFVPYELTFLHDGTAVSACGDFLTDHEEYIPACYVLKIRPKAGGKSTYQHYLDCCAHLGVNDAEAALAKMIVTDDLLGNTDRHLRNFGLIRDVDTLEYRPAPLFDTGSCLLHDKAASTLENGDISFATKPFSDDPNQQLRLVSDYSWFDESALEGFVAEATDTLRNNPTLKDRIPYITHLIETRLDRLRVIAS